MMPELRGNMEIKTGCSGTGETDSIGIKAFDLHAANPGLVISTTYDPATHPTPPSCHRSHSMAEAKIVLEHDRV